MHTRKETYSKYFVRLSKLITQEIFELNKYSLPAPITNWLAELIKNIKSQQGLFIAKYLIVLLTDPPNQQLLLELYEKQYPAMFTLKSNFKRLHTLLDHYQRISTLRLINKMENRAHYTLGEKSPAPSPNIINAIRETYFQLEMPLPSLFPSTSSAQAKTTALAYLKTRDHLGTTAHSLYLARKSSPFLANLEIEAKLYLHYLLFTNFDPAAITAFIKPFVAGNSIWHAHMQEKGYMRPKWLASVINALKYIASNTKIEFSYRITACHIVAQHYNDVTAKDIAQVNYFNSLAESYFAFREQLQSPSFSC